MLKPLSQHLRRLRPLSLSPSSCPYLLNSFHTLHSQLILLSFTWHAGEREDYLGRSWMAEPSHLKPDDEHTCYMPKKTAHTWAGHSKGVTQVRFFPKYGHLLLSASMDCTVKIWEAYGKKRCMQTYHAHSMPIRDIDFSADGTRFISTSFDKFTRVFDTESGKCLGSYTLKKTPVCCKFYPLDANQFIVGQKNNRAIGWDMRSGEMTQEYDRHLDQINTITFIDNVRTPVPSLTYPLQNRRFVTTSDDKAIRVWDYGVGVDVKYIADPSLHAIPAATLSPNGEWVLFQSMDNSIITYSADEKFRQNHKKTFRGHGSAGYACKPDMSPDGRFVVSGTSNGSIVFWDYKTNRIFHRLERAHQVLSLFPTLSISNPILAGDNWCPVASN